MYLKNMKKEQFKNGQPCTIDGAACCYLDLIWQEKNNCTYNNRRECPDNVMIHPIHRSNICRELESIGAFAMNKGKITHIFGIQVIWTYDIGKDEIICTYNSK
jgi:hypothetical protein